MTILIRDGASGVDDAFTDLPGFVYAGDPRWIPEDTDAVRRAFSPEHDWFKAGRAVTLCIPGRSRLAVFRGERDEIEGTPVAFFGYWENRGDSAATERLFREAEAWSCMSGAEVLYGPINFTTHGHYRLRTAAETNARPFVDEPYHPDAYPALLQSLGFAVAREYLTQLSAAPLNPKEAQRALHGLCAAGFTLEPLDESRWRSLLPELKPLIDSVFAQNFAFTPVSFATFAAGYAERVARRLCPRTSVLVRAPSGEIAAFALVYPDYGPLVMRGSGAPRVATAALSFAEHAPLLERMSERTAIVRTVGVAPAYRGRGITNALAAVLLGRGSAYYDRWIAALIRDDNLSRRFGDRQSHAQRKYALYTKRLTRVDS